MGGGGSELGVRRKCCDKLAGRRNQATRPLPLGRFRLLQGRDVSVFVGARYFPAAIGFCIVCGGGTGGDSSYLRRKKKTWLTHAFRI